MSARELSAAEIAERARRATAWDEQHRDGMSYSDLSDMLYSAVCDKFRPAGDDDGDEGYWYAYIVDFDDDAVVFSASGEKMRCSYEVDGATVTLGDAEPVRVRTTYVPLEVKSGNPATPKRAFATLVEQAPAQTCDLQVRLGDSDNDEAVSSTARFRGYAYTIDERYGVVDWLGEYQERIGPGASSKTLREQDSIPLLLNHDSNYVLANTRSKTQQLSDDGRGLLNTADLDRRQTFANDTCISLERGDVNKMSFSFRAVKEAWNDQYDDRYVTELQLYDTSIVTYPTNRGTSAELVDAMRSAMGREGRSLWLAEHEMSVRSALPFMLEARALPVDGEDAIERALRALAHADEIVMRSRGPHGRARTFRLAGAMLDMRAGKTLSAANQSLLRNALDVLAAADKPHAEVADAHSQARDAIQTALDSAKEGDGSGDPVSPQDAAGARSRVASLELARRRDRELAEIRRRRQSGRRA